MIKSIITFCFAFLISCLSYSQQSTKLEDFKHASIDSCISWMHINFRNVDIYHDLALQTLKRARAQSVDSITVKVHEEIAVWHAYNGIFSPDSVVYHTEKALEYHKKGTNQKKIADTYELLARDLIRVRDLEKAQDALFKSIAICETINDDDGLGKAFRTLGVLYRITEDYEKSIEYSLKAMPLLEATKNYGLLGMSQFNLIISYGELGYYKNAYDATEYALQVVREYVPEEVFIPVKALSYRGEVYVKQKAYEKALADYIKSWELCVAIIGEERCGTYRTEIGQVYLLQQDYGNALDHLLVGVSTYEQQGKTKMVDQYQNLSECYAQLGDFKNALLYQNKANNNKETVLEEKIANLESEMLIKYETGKKDEAIAAQELLLEQKSRVQSLIIAIASLLGILLFVMAYFFKRNKKKTAIIKTKNEENELLLKEIHHRVKNNLELVKSLIALQSAEITDDKTKEAMIASQNRVQSMGIIHQKLYQGENLGSVDMKDYFINLSNGVLDTFNKDDKVKIECAMDQLELDVDTAVPIGLIVNELLTNALKYAFPDNSEGTIQISLAQPESNVLTLKVSDNGIGKTKDSKVKGTGFGTQLINLLTRQLDGIMEETYHNGTSVSFQFRT